MKTLPTDSFVLLGHPRHFAQWNMLILSNAASEILVVGTSSSEPSGRKRRARGVASNEGAKDDLLDWTQQGECKGLT